MTSRASSNYAELWAKQQERSKRPLRGHPVSNSTAPKTMHSYVPACLGNYPNRSEMVPCASAYAMCSDTSDLLDFGYWLFSAPVGPPSSADWTATGAYICLGATDPNEPPPVIPVLTQEDFQRLPLPASPIVVQPPNGRTLVNIPTNLYADADTVTLPTTILGQPVQVRATPEEFRWTYGDGESLTTEDAGAAYPELRTAHVYQHSGARRVGLTTVYSGEYSVSGGPWLPVDGTATVESPVSTVQVVAAENRLVAAGS
ncbi:hypothetical protein KIH74_03355 [Kineosporia sp. J2-2]|uniref:PKD domain-containing protein n=1 Tax=Kineosporia corallincola TaxID=2835133 RepID=A0ABS5TA53_9ACTN|nr:hypothetical protein [Kineosporia corallincola]MBT0767944.1 hypothetical protein [Kineosporia corallincola]